jgi:protein gp37
MATMKTEISWADWTWNPVRGCTPVSPGCANCYAAGVAARFSGPGQPYEGLAEFAGERRKPRWAGKAVLVPSALAQPLSWRKKALKFAEEHGRRPRCFVNSMSDLFHESLRDEEIAAVFATMAACEEIDFLVLTKRAERMAAWFTWVADVAWPALHTEYQASLGWPVDANAVYTYAEGHDESACPLCRGACRIHGDGDAPLWPLPNLWLGVSVENQATADERIPDLLRTPAAIRFVSYEPALGAVDFWRLRDGSWYDREGAELYDSLKGVAYYRDGEHGLGGGPRLDWVIVGGESGPGHRPCDLEWISSAVEQCRYARVPVFVKQDSGPRSGMKGRIPDELWIQEMPR